MAKQRSVILVILVCLAIAAGPSTVYISAAPRSAPVLSGVEGPAPRIVEGDVVGEQVMSTGAPAGWWAVVQEDIRRSEYHVTWEDDIYLPDPPAAYHAPDRAYNLRAYFTPEGPVVIPRAWPEGMEAPPWRWGLRLVAWGREGARQPVLPVTLHPDANRIEYRRGALTEWYVNDERGLEQGFTLDSPPGPSSPGSLVLELVLTGDLTPHMTDDGTAIEFATPGGVRVLRYSDLRATDATGRELPTQMSLVPLDDAPQPHTTRHTHHASRFTLHVSCLPPSALPLTTLPPTTPSPLTPWSLLPTGWPRATGPTPTLATRWARREM